jgi:bacillopeptidase F
VSSSSAYGGSYALDHLANAQLTFKFTGTGITWYTNAGRNYGLAYVYIDGVLKGSFGQYASSTHYRVARNFGGLTSGSHTITIRVRGLKGASGGTGTDIAVDAFQVGATRFDTPSVTYSWRRAGTSLASGGAYAMSDGSGSAATFTFRGTGFDWYTVLGPSMGKANVYVDGVLIIQFDNYASSTQYNVRRTFRKLSDTIHTVTIKLTGTRRSASSGTVVAVDRWVVI